MTVANKAVCPLSDEEWAQLEQVLERFEEAWKCGPPPVLEEYVKASDVQRPTLVAELAHADLECRLKAGEAARVETYFERYPEVGSDPDKALDLIAAEFQLRRRQEADLTTAEYLQRFPQFHDQLTVRLQGPARGLKRPSLSLTCPQCRQPFSIEESTASEKTVCPSCGTRWRADPAHPHPSPGQALRMGKFELLEVVGQGAFGTVYRARDAELDRVVAVKVPRTGRWAAKADEDRFVREARNAARLSHPGIVPVHEVGRSETVPYIVCAYIEGWTLAETVAERRLSFAETADVIAQVAEALDHAHRHGVVHRDLKPSNIMLGRITGVRGQESGVRNQKSGIREKSSASSSLTPDPRPLTTAFVMDFGLARRAEGETAVTLDGQILGTPAYMSPEQARGKAHEVDGRGDLYSLGVILYELLTGELPFRGVARMVLHQILYEEPPSPRKLNDKVPRDLETITLKCLAKEPARRFDTASELAADLRRHLNGEPIRARPVGRLEQAWRWAKRKPWIAGLSAAVLFLFAALALGSSVAAVIFGRQRDAESAAKQEAEDNAKLANKAQKKAEDNEKVAQQQTALALKAKKESEDSKKQAEDNEKLALQAKKQAEESAQLASQRLELTLETLDKLVYEVHEHLQDRAALHKLRENLLKTALDGLERVAQTNQGVADHSMAAAHQRLGDIFLSLRRTAEAQEHYERFQTIAVALTKADPQNALFQRDLCLAQARLGDVYKERGKTDTALQAYKKALELAQALFDTRSHDPLARSDLSICHNRLGSLTLEQGDVKAARESFRRALELTQAAADPQSIRAKRDLATSYLNLGDASLQLADAAAAREDYRKAADLCKAWVQADRRSVRAIRTLAIAHDGLGDSNLRLKDDAAALEDYRQAVDLREALAAADPLSALARRELAIGYAKLGDVSDQQGDVKLARAYYAKALVRCEDLAKADPRSAVARRDLSTAYEKLGIVSWRMGDLNAARDFYGRALARREELARDDKQSFQAQTDLAAILGNLGLAELQAQEFARAADCFQRGVDILSRLNIKDQPGFRQWLRAQQQKLAICKAAEKAIGDLEYLLRQPADQVAELLFIRARALARRGKHEDAVATADRLRTLLPEAPTHLANAACGYALCAAGIASGKPLDQLTAEEKAARARHIVRAVEILTEAVKQGFKNVVRLEYDPDLAALRPERDYQKLLDDLKARNRPK